MLKISTISLIGAIVDSEIELENFYKSIKIKPVDYVFKGSKLVIRKLPSYNCIISKQFEDHVEGTVKKKKKFFRNQLSLKVFIENKKKIVSLKIFRKTIVNGTSINKVHVCGITNFDILSFFNIILKIKNQIILKEIIANHNFDFSFKINKQLLNDFLDNLKDRSITLNSQMSLSSAGLSVVISSPADGNKYIYVEGKKIEIINDHHNIQPSQFFRTHDDVFSRFNTTSILIFHSGKMISSGKNTHVAKSHVEKIIHIVNNAKKNFEIKDNQKF